MKTVINIEIYIRSYFPATLLWVGAMPALPRVGRQGAFGLRGSLSRGAGPPLTPSASGK